MEQEEEARHQLQQAKKKMDQEIANMKKELEEINSAYQKTEADKVAKEAQIKNLNEEIAHQEELIAKLNKEKKAAQENAQKSSEDVQVFKNLFFNPT